MLTRVIFGAHVINSISYRIVSCRKNYVVLLFAVGYDVFIVTAVWSR